MMTRTVSRSWWLVALLLVAPSIAGRAQAPQIPPGAKAIVGAGHLRMPPEEGSGPGATLVFGDPAKPGFYVYRIRFRPGVMSRPHYHDQDRWVTVISGTWWTDENSDVFRPDKTVPVKAGGFMFHPKGLHHYDGAKNEDAVVQIMGMGPVKTIDTEVTTPRRN